MSCDYVFYSTTLSIAGILENVFGWKGSAVVILVIEMVTDYLLGIISAWKNGSLKKEKAISGALGKLAAIIVIFAVSLADMAIPMLIEHIPIHYQIKWPEFLFPILLVAYIVWELRSILKNAKKAGAHIPEWLCKIMNI